MRLGLLLLLFIYKAESSEAVTHPLHIGSELQLFWDYHLIDEKRGEIAVIAHKPRKEDIVLTLDKPWEGNVSAYVTTIKDNLYKMYYRCAGTKNGKMPPLVNTCYAESKDGINWVRPNLGIVEFQGQGTNIVLQGPNDGVTHNFTPFLDTKANIAENEKYKATGWYRTETDAKLLVYQSRDGIKWTKVDKEALELKGAFDSQNVAFYDQIASEYKLYFREYTKGKRFKDGIRAVAISSSRDFKSWTEPELLEYRSLQGATLPETHLYTSQIQPYYRNPNIYVGFPARLFPKTRNALLEPVFIHSRNGYDFTRFGESIVRPGLNPKAWSNRSNFIWLGVVETASDVPNINELSIYGNESYNQADVPTKIRRYTYRIDGFASLQASLSGGSVVTKPFVFKGKSLQLNYATSAAGIVKVQILDSEGVPISGFSSEIYGDKLDEVVKWSKQTSLRNLEGKVIRLKFTLKDSNLYSFKFVQ